MGLMPNRGVAWMMKGEALAGLGRHQEALEAYEQTIRRNAQDDIYWLGKGMALEDLGRHQEAQAAWKEADKLKGK